MKSMVFAAVVAGSMFAVAAEAEKPAAATPAAPVAAEAAKVAPKRPQFSAADRAKMRERFMAERKAQMEAKLMEVVKKYVPEEEKAKALVNELQEAMMASRRSMMQRRPQMLPAASAAKPVQAKPAEAKPAEAK